MKTIFSFLLYFYIPIFARAHVSPVEASELTNSFVPTQSPMAMGSGPVSEQTVIPVPKHVLAQYGIFDNPPIYETDLIEPEPTSNPLVKRLTTLICKTTVDSPLEPDIRVLVEYLKRERWNWYCKQATDGMPYCTQLATHRTAAIGICGPYQHQMMCQDVAFDVTEICALCTRHINNDDRVGGIAVATGRLGSGFPLFRGLIAYHSNKLGQGSTILLENLYRKKESVRVG